MFLLFFVISGCSTYPSPYFPSRTFSDKTDLDIFISNWYSKNLTALCEPSLYEARIDNKITMYRFTWLRTFHHPVVVRIVLESNSGTIISKVCDGAGGYDPGKLIVDKQIPLSCKDKTKLLKAMEANRFWDIPSYDLNKNGCDGAQWIVEGVMAGKYHIVDRWSPESGSVRNLGLLFLELGNIDETTVY